MMTEKTVGIVHPGDMGISVAATLQKGGHKVLWASEGRSRATQDRAIKHNLVDVVSVGALCRECQVIVSVCPPHAAEATAQMVLDAGFTGTYLDANAIAPERAIRMSQRMLAVGAAFVDGGIIGGPAWKPNTTWLYLAGSHAPEVAELFAAGPMAASVMGERVGDASALKMCYAAFTKGSTALLSASLAAADALGVREALMAQWAHDDPALPERNTQRVRTVTAKAWRFVGEMDEIAATLGAAGLPDGFHAAAAEVYRRMAEFKDAPSTPELEAVLAALNDSSH